MHWLILSFLYLIYDSYSGKAILLTSLNKSFKSRYKNNALQLHNKEESTNRNRMCAARTPYIKLYWMHETGFNAGKPLGP